MPKLTVEVTLCFIPEDNVSGKLMANFPTFNSSFTISLTPDFSAMAAFLNTTLDADVFTPDFTES